jgi:hypothetical protein
MASLVQLQPVDPAERRRQRARERYAMMDTDKKNELLKKRREARQKRKTLTSEKEDVVSDEDTEWLSRNDMYRRQPIHMSSDEQELQPTGMKATISWLIKLYEVLLTIHDLLS